MDDGGQLEYPKIARPQPQQPPYSVKISTSPLRCQFRCGHRISSYTVGLVCTSSHFTPVSAHSGGDKQRKNLPIRTYTATCGVDYNCSGISYTLLNGQQQ
ncbi:uncharacterized protein BDCG_05793 [Blastomyces dermatitidis ER-3]|uniref:Uncharacterized protein n=2 Tax=Blastomyces TaxID=229219 RepID=A0A179UVG3_BLAGS|nr:uncharacterized protein BDBG_06161 [Blastomyces gilchristii SLH14081]XP_045277363.1 uncharacterized protein BDCG_05793 [Blastomyces dermatitidis ER-3]EEQ90673.2 hypothetical protein BDCG_05793 [Blastomyces dermatitidis ER-3]OAT11219.1 hypothetical protein BDBG_06161 [Blastomyces gilchristii SLH14081]